MVKEEYESLGFEMKTNEKNYLRVVARSVHLLLLLLLLLLYIFISFNFGCCCCCFYFHSIHKNTPVLFCGRKYAFRFYFKIKLNLSFCHCVCVREFLYYFLLILFHNIAVVQFSRKEKVQMKTKNEFLGGCNATLKHTMTGFG
jgi:hypothetical protein